jgi:DNA polymerase III epsilon subunit-like protein
MKVLVFDTETTGLLQTFQTTIFDTDKCPYIVQLSWILYDTDDHTLLNCQDHLIDCPIEIPPESTKIHGIKNSYTKRKGVPIDYAMDLFDLDVQRCDTIVAHNVSFDKRMCMLECIRLKRQHPFIHNGLTKPIYCTMMESKSFCNIIRPFNHCNGTYVKFPKLIELHDALFGYTPKGAHDAMADVLICLRCYMKYKDDIDVVKHNRTLSKMFELYCGSYR